MAMASSILPAWVLSPSRPRKSGKLTSCTATVMERFRPRRSDNHGQYDLNTATNSIDVMLGDGDGAFSPPAPYGVSGGAVDYEIVKLATSLEFQHDTVNSLYQQYLHRAPEAEGEQFWAAYLYSRGGTIEGMAEALIGSDEYY